MLEGMACPAEHWVRLATYQLEGDAFQWWRFVWQLKFSKLVTVEVNWKDFEVAFYEKYFPDHVWDRFDQEFQSMQGGNMTVSKYEAAFAHLECFTQVFDSEEQRA